MKILHIAMTMTLSGVLLFASLARAAIVEKCDQYDTVDIRPSTKIYVVQNNVWNDVNGSQCISTDDSTGAFSVTSSNHNKLLNGKPASYLSVFKGCHWGNCTNARSSGMPKQVISILHATTSWSTVQPNSGAYNAAYDIWLSEKPTASSEPLPPGAEIMIWLNKRGDIQPDGALISKTVPIDGTTWDVWVAYHNGIYVVSYVRTTGVASVSNLNIMSFIINAYYRGYVKETWYLLAVEAGFEIWQTGVGLKSTSFSVLVE